MFFGDMDVTKDMLVRYLSCETTLAEETAIVKWLDKDPSNRKELNDLDFAYSASLMASVPKSACRRRCFSSVWRVAAAAAAVALFVGLSITAGVVTSNRNLSRIAEKTMEFSVPVGQRVNVKLPDGTSVTLNSGATLKYPSVFLDGTRDVYVRGEAMFDVAHDAAHPFIVHTSEGTVEALGTVFCVKAFENMHVFYTALLEGAVRVTSSGDQVILSPGQKAVLKDSRLLTESIADKDDFLWTDGIISLDGKSFGEIMCNFESAYGFNIIYRSDFIPQMRCRGKIRIADGIDHAISVLKKGGTQFNYEVDYNLKEVYIW